MKSNNPMLFLYSAFWKFSKSNHKKVIIYTILSIIANTVLIISPLLISQILNLIQASGVNESNIFTIISLLGFYLVLDILFWLFHWPSRVIERENAFIVRANYKEFLMKNIAMLPVSWHAENHSGDINDKIDKSSNALFLFSGDTFTIIGPTISFILSIIMLLFIYPASIIIIFPIFLIAIFVSMKFDKILIKQYTQLNKSENHIAEKIIDALTNIFTVIILRIERQVNKSINLAINSPKNVYYENIKLNETKWMCMSILGASMVLLVLSLYLFNSLLSGVILIGTIYLLFDYSQKIRNIFYQFTLRYGILTQQMTAVKNIDPIITAFEKKKKVKRFKLNDWKQIRIKGLNFSYYRDNKENDDDLHLNKVSFNIDNGERIAFVGESGSGKSTMLKLLRGLYTPNKGEVFVDDFHLKNFFKQINYKISLIPQEPEIFKNTIKYNITLGAKYRKDHIDEVCKLACFDKIVNKLPQNYETNVGEKGAKLSGGEKQRLALARGILASENKEIILLDEPTSSIDAENELIIYNNLFKKFDEKTIISTIHRLHLLHLFDRIVFFKNGRIIAIGTLNEVLENPDFKALWDKSRSK
ncbi:MAG: ABC transporter ATP-binding protein [archaeon]|jgi:ABC-type multidrug transport system fused ATPase/permease subunit